MSRWWYTAFCNYIAFYCTKCSHFYELRRCKTGLPTARPNQESKSLLSHTSTWRDATPPQNRPTPAQYCLVLARIVHQLSSSSMVTNSPQKFIPMISVRIHDSKSNNGRIGMPRPESTPWLNGVLWPRFWRISGIPLRECQREPVSVFVNRSKSPGSLMSFLTWSAI